MAEFKDNLKRLRTEAGMTQADLAQRLGKAQSCVGMYESGQRRPNFDILAKLADIFDTDMNCLLTGQNMPMPAQYRDIINVNKKAVPVIGDIACGEPIFAEEEHEGFLEADSATDFDFCLRCVGDSMINAGIPDGAMVFIRKQDMVENGEIAAVIIGGSITLKRVAYYPEKNTLILKPENPRYGDLVYIGSELDDIRILGKAVAIQIKL